MPRPSKKPSATRRPSSARERQRRELVFFVDRSLGRKDVPEALKAAGLNVQIHDEHYTADTEDVVWLAEVSAKGWIVLTKDKAIRRRAFERQRIQDYRGRAFFIAAKGQSGGQMADLLLGHLTKLQRVAAGVEPPFIALVNQSGVLLHDPEEDAWISATEALRRARRRRNGP